MCMGGEGWRTKRGEERESIWRRGDGEHREERRGREEGVEKEKWESETHLEETEFVVLVLLRRKAGELCCEDTRGGLVTLAVRLRKSCRSSFFCTCKCECVIINVCECLSIFSVKSLLLLWQ